MVALQYRVQCKKTTPPEKHNKSLNISFIKGISKFNNTVMTHYHKQLSDTNLTHSNAKSPHYHKQLSDQKTNTFKCKKSHYHKQLSNKKLTYSNTKSQFCSKSNLQFLFLVHVFVQKEKAVCSVNVNIASNLLCQFSIFCFLLCLLPNACFLPTIPAFNILENLFDKSVTKP